MHSKDITTTATGGEAPAVPRAVAYLRVSTALQEKEGLGLPAQRTRVREYAETHCLDVVDIVEEAASGTVKAGEDFSWEHRPVLLELMERARSGEYDVLLVAKFDRLSRDYATQVAVERRLERVGVTIASASTDENGTGPIAKYLRGNLALVAELEAAMISDRLSYGKAEAARLGRHTSGRIPYGFKVRTVEGLRDRGALVIDEQTAPIVRRIYADVWAGRSLAGIAVALNAESVPPSQGGAWTHSAVGRIVRNRANIGERHGIKKAHPAIVTVRQFNAAQRALEARSRAS